MEGRFAMIESDTKLAIKAIKLFKSEIKPHLHHQLSWQTRWADWHQQFRISMPRLFSKSLESGQTTLRESERVSDHGELFAETWVDIPSVQNGGGRQMENSLLLTPQTVSWYLVLHWSQRWSCCFSSSGKHCLASLSQSPCVWAPDDILIFSHVWPMLVFRVHHILHRLMENKRNVSLVLVHGVSWDTSSRAGRWSLTLKRSEAWQSTLNQPHINNF